MPPPHPTPPHTSLTHTPLTHQWLPPAAASGSSLSLTAMATTEQREGCGEWGAWAGRGVKELGGGRASKAGLEGPMARQQGRVEGPQDRVEKCEGQEITRDWKDTG